MPGKRLCATDFNPFQRACAVAVCAGFWAAGHVTVLDQVRRPATSAVLRHNQAKKPQFQSPVSNRPRAHVSAARHPKRAYRFAGCSGDAQAGADSVNAGKVTPMNVSLPEGDHGSPCRFPARAGVPITHCNQLRPDSTISASPLCRPRPSAHKAKGRKRGCGKRARPGLRGLPVNCLPLRTTGVLAVQPSPAEFQDGA